MNFPKFTSGTHKIYCKEENTFDPNYIEDRIVLPDGWEYVFVD